jgi:hypothetical protein
MHYVESSNAVARWECTLQKVWRKDVAHCMDELGEIVAVFEETDEVKERRTTTAMGVHTLNKIQLFDTLSVQKKNATMRFVPVKLV